MIVSVVNVHLLAIMCLKTIENISLIWVFKPFANMFANFIQITINSQDRKHRLLELNNIGKGDFL